MRIAVTGAGGLLGGRLASLLSTKHETTALVRTQPAPEGIPSQSADLTDEDAVVAAFRTLRPEALVHCAALADPEICEREPERAHRENVKATKILARVCHLEGTRLISISTDLVFDGAAAFSTETSATAPLMEYGRLKLRAETAALEENPDVVILRVALICGRGQGRRLTASESLARRLLRGETVSLFEDEWRTPIDPESAAEAVCAVLLRPQVKGRFHIGGAERLSRVELGKRVAHAIGLGAGLIRSSTRSTHQGAPRPADVSLDIGRALEELEWKPRPLDIALSEGRR